MTIEIPYTPNKKQGRFHACGAEETVYGGAKGGGKSCALVMEALAYSLEHPGATLYLFRETYDDLEANLVHEWRTKVPETLYTYNGAKHLAQLINGSRVFFRYISNDGDADRYQGRSMDWIGVDELTKHSQYAVQVLLSCLRSPKGFPPRFRGTCNPGGKGHEWVKRRYIEGTEHGRIQYQDEATGNRIAFIPAQVYDNDVLMANDPAYIKRLENLPEAQKKAFLYGDWDIFEGQFFAEFRRELHVVEPFPIPEWWRRYYVMDYGLDMLAGYWIATDPQGRAVVYREIYEGKDRIDAQGNPGKGLIVSEAAALIKEAGASDKVDCYYGPPDLWNRQKDTGKSIAELFADNGVPLVQTRNDRVSGWMDLREWLAPCRDETGQVTARLRIFSTCRNLIRCLPALQYSERDPDDAATEPHEVTHAPDAIRYFVAGRPLPAQLPVERDPDEPPEYEEQVQDFLDYGG